MLRRPLILLAVIPALMAPTAAAAAPDLAQSQASVERLERELARLDARVGAVAADHNAAVDRIEAIDARLRTARGQLTAARTRARLADAALGERLRALYAMREPTDAELLLSSGSVAELDAVHELLDRVAARDAELVGTVRAERDETERLGRRLSEERALAAQEAARLAGQRTRLDVAVAARERVLAGARASLRAAVTAEHERRQRMAALAASSPEGAAGPTPIAPSAAQLALLPSGGTYVFPVRGGARYSDDWMAARAGGRVHEGIDLFAAEATPVVAVADGTVFRVGWNTLGGRRLWLRDGGGTEFYYAHLSAYAPPACEGAVVTRGTVLGYVGHTGDARTTPPHLHFEIHPAGGGPVRPFPIVAAWPVAS